MNSNEAVTLKSPKFRGNRAAEYIGGKVQNFEVGEIADRGWNLSRQFIPRQVQNCKVDEFVKVRSRPSQTPSIRYFLIRQV